MSAWLRARRRLDGGAAALIAVALSPVMLIVAVLIRVTDGRPVVLSLMRVGRNGEIFGMLKFRTMQPDVSGSVITAAGDSRVTRTGSLLRRLHLDELPQLWNVVCGQMALIGPRPETPEFFDADSEQWARVLAVPPGIAGASQVAIADWEASILDPLQAELIYRQRVLPVKLAIDEWYVARATFWTDVTVLVSLCQRMLFRTSETLMLRATRRAVPATAAIAANR